MKNKAVIIRIGVRKHTNSMTWRMKIFKGTFGKHLQYLAEHFYM